ncbi:hypothetical protein [Telluribacter sp. SYSU D00476]|uniref:hypothetical protein n=1 Tax=Telluribacter sp. SYSU D00476 TaxID=2811430 RepID=UPI001FF2A74A|nr:hypothetical protein [Telluribacter sp. SYSU D00476]
MKPFVLFLLFSVTMAIEGNSQTPKYPVPQGYYPYLDLDKKPYSLSADFDNDGVKDLVTVYSKSRSGEEENRVAVYLSSVYSKSNTVYSFPFSTHHYDLQFNDKTKVLSVGACLGNGRFCMNFKFKYYPSIASMRLIGYDEESFGNAVHEGAYTKTVNLLTNKYDITKPTLKKKITKEASLPVMSLANFGEKDIERLGDLGRSLIDN